MLLNKIVVAEDDDEIAHMVNMALGDAGFLCLRARDGVEAINLVKVQSPDLLILDIMMPRCDGMEVVRKLRADVITSKTPILMLTALGTVESKIEGLEAGADDYVSKPFDLRELAARVKALIRGSRRERERSPTTGLPGSSAIDDHLVALLAAGADVAVVHAHADGFDALVDRVGFSQAETFVQSLGAAVLSRARAVADDAFVGHLGGVDFLVTCPSSVAAAFANQLIATFDDSASVWAGGEGLRLTVAITAAADGVPGDDGAAGLAHRLAAAMRSSKQRAGSNYVAWSCALA